MANHKREDTGAVFFDDNASGHSMVGAITEAARDMEFWFCDGAAEPLLRARMGASRAIPR